MSNDEVEPSLGITNYTRYTSGTDPYSGEGIMQQIERSESVTYQRFSAQQLEQSLRELYESMNREREFIVYTGSTGEQEFNNRLHDAMSRNFPKPIKDMKI